MTALKLIKAYFVWHYTRAIFEGWHIFLNLEGFLYNLFSIKLLLLTLFSKWRRLGEKRIKKFDIADFLTVLFVNTIMRIVGTCMRFLFIVLGAMSMALLFVVATTVFFVWFFVPLLVILLIVMGFHLLFS